MLSVGLFTYSTKPRGSVVHAACLAEALTARGVDVTLYALSKAGDGFFRPLRCATRLFPAAEAPADADALIRQRIAELQRGLADVRARHDVWHAQDCLTASALLTSERMSYRPVVRTVHHVERFESPFLAACQRRSIEQAELLLSVSDFTAREVRSEFGRRATVIHNGVEHERFAPRGESSALLDVRTRFGIAVDERIVLSVGGVEERKNSLRALEAMSRTLREHPRLRWVIVGGASIWEHAAFRAEFAARLGALPEAVSRRISLVGAVEEDALTALYRASEVLLCPSLHEGWGLCVLEAMAAGTSVICSEREPFTEFTDLTTAELIDPLNVDAIAAALARLLGQPAHRRRLVLAGQLRARNYSWERAARLHERAYQRLLRERAEHAERPARAAYHL